MAEANNSSIENLVTCCSACGKAATTTADGGDGAAAAADNSNGLKCCSVCRSVQYCSVECQKSDWSLHKKACTLGAVKLLIDAISDNNQAEITRLSKTKRVVNGKVDYTYQKNNPDDDDDDDDYAVTLAQWTALHACVRSRNIAAMKILLENGAKTEIQDVDEETPLFVASSISDHPEIVQCLLDHGANPNAMAQDGWTCIMMAARGGDHVTTKALLQAGADIYLGRDMFGRTVLDLTSVEQGGNNGVGLRMKQGESFEQAQLKRKKTYEVLMEHQNNRNQQSR